MIKSIITLAGKKKSGKDTLGNFLREEFNRRGFESKVYHFADKLKEFAVEYLELPRELVYGTDNDKNQLSHLHWKQIPFYERLKQEFINKNLGQFFSGLTAGEHFDLRHDKLMTIREVLQFWGTEGFRHSHGGNYWVRQLHKQILKEQIYFPIVCDCRFAEEVFWAKENGIVIKLTRGVKGDGHASETSLDPENFCQSHFSAIIDNQNQSLEETKQEILKTIKKLGLLNNK